MGADQNLYKLFDLPRTTTESRQAAREGMESLLEHFNNAVQTLVLLERRYGNSCEYYIESLDVIDKLDEDLMTPGSRQSELFNAMAQDTRTMASVQVLLAFGYGNDLTATLGEIGDNIHSIRQRIESDAADLYTFDPDEVMESLKSVGRELAEKEDILSFVALQRATLDSKIQNGPLTGPPGQFKI